MQFFDNIPKPIILLIMAICLYFFFDYLSPKKQSQQPYSDNIEKLTIENKNYRQVLYTTDTLQLVLMSLRPKEEIGMEFHENTTQFFRAEKGHGQAVINNQVYPLNDGDVVVIPPNTYHNIINLDDNEPLQLYGIYSPPHHPPNRLDPIKPKYD